MSNPIDDGIMILLPVYDDWAALRMVIQSVDSALAEKDVHAEVLIVDDGSNMPNEESYYGEQCYSAIKTIEALVLARNLGHQRAIAVGLAHIDNRKPGKAVVIMDADGEDSPYDVPRLIEAFQHNKNRIVFAQRAKRSEGLAFKAFYRLYQNIYRFLTGSEARFGNFSIIPSELVAKLVVVSEIWNHYAAGVMKAGVPYTGIPTTRTPRLAGCSRMSFLSLVIHGLSAISVHADIIGVRALVATLSLVVAIMAGLSVVVVIRVFTDLAIPGWASFVTLLLLILGAQAIMVALLFVFMILTSRSGLGFIPRRDYHHFVFSVRRLYPQR